MGGSKKTTTTSNQNSTATTTLPEWMTSAGQQNFSNAAAYVNGPDAVWSADKAASYANPFQQQVQQGTLTEMRRQGEIDHANLNDQVTAAKAYGGTRGAVLESELARNQAQQRDNYLATSNAQGYQQARSEFDADRAAKMGGYQTLTQILQGTPRNVTTTGSSNGTETSVQKGSFIDTLLAAAQIAGSVAVASDPRLKKDVSLIERLANGLGVYLYHYIWQRPSETPHIGVMADEVARLVPEALGPTIAGYLTVNYAKLAEAL